MIKYEHLRREPPGKFKRATGLTKESFETLCEKTEAHLREEKERNPQKRRGLKAVKLLSTGQ
jgi:hypothetical protein